MNVCEGSESTCIKNKSKREKKEVRGIKQGENREIG